MNILFLLSGFLFEEGVFCHFSLFFIFPTNSWIPVMTGSHMVRKVSKRHMYNGSGFPSPKINNLRKY